jgi:hypothetical protein
LPEKKTAAMTYLQAKEKNRGDDPFAGTRKDRGHDLFAGKRKRPRR